MERFIAAVRRLFGKKENNGENHNNDKTEPNAVQTAQRKQHPYDDVAINAEGPSVGEESSPNESQTQRKQHSYDDVTMDGAGPSVGGESPPHEPNEFQTPKRAPRSYDEVDVQDGGKVEVNN